MLIWKDARVIGAVSDVGGILGLGGKKVVIPTEQSQQTPAFEKITRLAAPLKALKSAI